MHGVRIFRHEFPSSKICLRWRAKSGVNKKNSLVSHTNHDICKINKNILQDFLVQDVTQKPIDRI